MNPNQEERKPSSPDRSGSHAPLGSVTLCVAAMTLLFAGGAALEARQFFSLTSATNGDIWWHLRTGLWILQNHSVPHSGLFSQSADAPWAAMTWGYDLKLALAYRMFGLGAIPTMLMAFRWALAVMTFVLAGGLRNRFWSALALSAIAEYILSTVPPGPSYYSLLLFAVELLLLRHARESDSVRPLYWLAAVFLVWANLDIQFVYGIALLALFLAALWLQGNKPLARRAGLAVGLCVAATVVTPYFWRGWGAFFASVTRAANRYLPDFHAMSFHRPQDYALLLVTMTAFLALGMRRSRDLFPIGLLTGGTMLAFHAQRDAWLAVLAAVAVIGGTMLGRAVVGEVVGEAVVDGAITSGVVAGNESLVGKEALAAGEVERRSEGEAISGSVGWGVGLRNLLIASGISFAILIFVALWRIPRDERALLAVSGQSYPVAACDYIREHRLPLPLFNAYEWGGFVLWYLPEYPVSIDGRADLYGDEAITLYSKVMNAELPYTADPKLTEAGTLLLPRHSLMGEALSTLPEFRVAYSDSVAVVLVKR